MKIAVPVDDTKEKVCVSFGRAPYFLLWEDGKESLLPNPAAEAQGGAGLQAAQFVADQGAEVLLTVRCGENAAEVLTASDIQIFKTQSPSVSQNISDYQEGKLARLTQFHAGYHGLR